MRPALPRGPSGRELQLRAGGAWTLRPAGHSYTVGPARAERFYRVIRRYWPRLSDGSLYPGYAGIRPKLGGPDAGAADFRLQDAQAHAHRTAGVTRDG